MGRRTKPRRVTPSRPIPHALRGLRTKLLRPFHELDFPARIHTFAWRRGLTRLHDLVLLSPNALLREPGLGKRSLAAARKTIRKILRIEWDALQVQLVPVERREETFPMIWERLRGELSPRAKAIPLDRVMLPFGLKSLASTAGASDVGALLALDVTGIAPTMRFGTKAKRDAVDALRALDGPRAERDGARHWRTLFEGAVASLPRDQRSVAEQRFWRGVSLADIGANRGVSKIRVWQIEKNALDRLRRLPWITRLVERLRRAATRDVQSEAMLSAVDRGFSFNPGDALPFQTFVNRVLDCEVRALEIEGRVLLTTIPEAEVRARLLRLRAAWSALPTPPHSPARAVSCLAKELGWDTDDVLPFLAMLDGVWMAHGSDVAAPDPVRSFMRERLEPVDLDELTARFGTFRSLPPGMIYVDACRVTLLENIPDWDEQCAALPERIAAILLRLDKSTAMTTGELLPLLGRQTPAWLNQWSLGSLLRTLGPAAPVRYAGRGIVELTPKTSVDILREVTLALLRTEGAPMPEHELVTRLRRSERFGRLVWSVLRSDPAFIVLGDERIGLVERDLPGGAEARSAAIEAVLGVIPVGSRLEGRKVVRYVAGLGPQFRKWDVRVLWSVLERDRRLCIDSEGGVSRLSD